MALKSRISTVSGSRIVISTGELQSRTANSSGDFLNLSISGKGSDHPFDSTHVKCSGSLISGQRNDLSFDSWPGSNYTSSPGDFIDGPENATTQALLAATNPSRPVVQLPVFAFELKDLPDMLRQVGRFCQAIYFYGTNPRLLIRPWNRIKDLAALNLAYQFGWRPFVADLWKIATLQDQIEKRRKELTKLYDKGLRRRVNFGDAVPQTQSGSWNHNSDHGVSIDDNWKLVSTAFSWGVAVWKPTTGMPKWVPTDGQLRRQLTGLSADAILSNLWEALPWSWLADWFAPIGQTIQGMNRTIATPVSCCIMTTSIATRSFTGRVYPPPSTCVLTPGTVTNTRHKRSISGGTTATASIPLLGANQLSLLGSLAVLRH